VVGTVVYGRAPCGTDRTKAKKIEFTVEFLGY
jgi:hypothetical protein